MERLSLCPLLAPRSNEKTTISRKFVKVYRLIIFLYFLDKCLYEIKVYELVETSIAVPLSLASEKLIRL